ncbi:hypothetical protein MPH_13448, partial [Macrophomina phaseolina MS6]
IYYNLYSSYILFL